MNLQPPAGGKNPRHGRPAESGWVVELVGEQVLTGYLKPARIAAWVNDEIRPRPRTTPRRPRSRSNGRRWSLRRISSSRTRSCRALRGLLMMFNSSCSCNRVRSNKGPWSPSISSVPSTGKASAPRCCAPRSPRPGRRVRSFIRPTSRSRSSSSLSPAESGVGRRRGRHHQQAQGLRRGCHQQPGALAGTGHCVPWQQDEAIRKRKIRKKTITLFTCLQ